MAWKTILVPHDFSTSAHHAQAIACEVAAMYKATLVLLHVVDLPYQIDPDAVVVPPEIGTPISLKEYALQKADTHLQEIVDRLAKDSITATTDVVTGDPLEEINHAVQRHHVDLIVMGTHGRTGIRHLMAGSVAERVVRTSKVPVLTIRHPE